MDNWIQYAIVHREDAPGKDDWSERVCLDDLRPKALRRFACRAIEERFGSAAKATAAVDATIVYMRGAVIAAFVFDGIKTPKKWAKVSSLDIG